MDWHDLLTLYPQGITFINDIIKHIIAFKHIITCKINKWKEKGNDIRAQFLDRRRYRLGNPTDKAPEVEYIPRMIVIHPPDPHLQEQLERLNTIMVGSGGSSQDFIFITRKELEMRRRNIRVLLYIALTDVGNILNEVVQIGLLANSILCKINHRPDFPYHPYPKHRMKMTPTKYYLPMKLNIPRGIHCDGRGRLQKQNLTSSRLSRRNGSRK